jgi:hypothetical protein
VTTSYSILNSRNITKIVHVLAYKFSIRSSSDCINSSNVLEKASFLQMLLLVCVCVCFRRIHMRVVYHQAKEMGMQLPWQ